MTKDEFCSALTLRREIDSDGTVRWFNADGERHRENGPAVEYIFGSSYWFLNDKCHREDGPAIEYSDGSKAWFLNGEYHRDDGPAVEEADGSKYWYKNGQEVEPF